MYCIALMCVPFFSPSCLSSRLLPHPTPFIRIRIRIPIRAFTTMLACDAPYLVTHRIPQDPHLFSSTIRYNLDPLQRHSDAELWNALEDAHIKEHISAQPLGLSMLVEEGGKNFSVGQRQLISLARAIVRRSRVVLMDEVTASIDYETDKCIQNTIRTSVTLKNATIITVFSSLCFVLLLGAGSFPSM